MCWSTNRDTCWKESCSGWWLKCFQPVENLVVSSSSRPWGPQLKKPPIPSRRSNSIGPVNDATATSPKRMRIARQIVPSMVGEYPLITSQVVIFMRIDPSGWTTSLKPPWVFEDTEAGGRCEAWRSWRGWTNGPVVGGSTQQTGSSLETNFSALDSLEWCYKGKWMEMIEMIPYIYIYPIYIPYIPWFLPLMVTQVAQVLLKHGADATRCDKEGTSVLGAATAGRCNDDLVLALLAVNGSLGWWEIHWGDL